MTQIVLRLFSCLLLATCVSCVHKATKKPDVRQRAADGSNATPGSTSADGTPTNTGSDGTTPGSTATTTPENSTLAPDAKTAIIANKDSYVSTIPPELVGLYAFEAPSTYVGRYFVIGGPYGSVTSLGLREEAENCDVFSSYQVRYDSKRVEFTKSNSWIAETIKGRRVEPGDPILKNRSEARIGQMMIKAAALTAALKSRGLDTVANVGLVCGLVSWSAMSEGQLEALEVFSENVDAVADILRYQQVPVASPSSRPIGIGFDNRKIRSELTLDGCWLTWGGYILIDSHPGINRASVTRALDLCPKTPAN
jgi:hypothetical protein